MSKNFVTDVLVTTNYVLIKIVINTTFGAIYVSIPKEQSMNLML